jgi:hypothetical protein
MRLALRIMLKAWTKKRAGQADWKCTPKAAAANPAVIVCDPYTNFLPFCQGMTVGKSAKRAGGMQAKAMFLVVGKKAAAKKEKPALRQTQKMTFSIPVAAWPPEEKTHQL